MKINHDFQAVIPGPTNHPVEVFGLTLDIRLAARYVVGPVSDRHADVVQPRRYEGGSVLDSYHGEAERQRDRWKNEDPPAIWARSPSWIHEFQWFTRAFRAVL